MPAAVLDVLARAAAPAGAAAAALVACALIGLAVLRGRLRSGVSEADLALAISVGFTTSGLAIWIVGTLWRSTAALPLFLALACLAGIRFPLLVRHLGRVSRRLAALLRRRPLTTLAVAIPVVLSGIQTLLPLMDSDGLRYHVALPKLFLLTGQVRFYPWDVTGGFPQTTEMLIMAGLQATTGEFAKFFHFGFFLAALAVLMLCVHRGRSSRDAAVFAALFFVATPVVLSQAPVAFVDHVALFHLAVALLLVRRRASAVKIGLALAGAVVTKYTAVPAVLAILVVVAARSRSGARLRTLALATAPAVLAFAPFALRNLAATGDPIYPVGHGLLRQPIPGVTEVSLAWARDYHGEIAGLGGITWTAASGSVQGDEVAGPHHLLGLPAALLTVSHPELRVLLAPVLAYAAIGLAVHPPTRYLLPMLWCLAALEGLAAARWLRRWAAVAVLAVAAPGWVHGVKMATGQFDPLAYLTGSVSREELLRRWVPGYSVTRRLNSLPPGGRVMALDFPATYYLDRPWIAEGTLNEPPLATWVTTASSAEELLQRLQTADVRYLLVTPPYGGGTRASLLPLSRDQHRQGLLLGLRRHLELLGSEDGVDLYVVPDARAATSTMSN